MNRVSVLFFATLKDLAGTKETTLDLPEGAVVRDFKLLLVDLFPKLTPAMESALISINREYAFDEDVVPKGAEVALFPPVSGGAGDGLPSYCAVTEEEISLNDLVTKITLPSTGAVCLFTGTVRAITRRYEPYETEYLEYEAYKPMAEQKLHQVVGEIRTRWSDIKGIAIVQRIGRLDPGTPTVLIACSASHRDTGIFEAARYGINRLKEIVPVWKKEFNQKGEVWVEGDYFPTRNDVKND